MAIWHVVKKGEQGLTFSHSHRHEGRSERSSRCREPKKRGEKEALQTLHRRAGRERPSMDSRRKGRKVPEVSSTVLGDPRTRSSPQPPAGGKSSLASSELPELHLANPRAGGEAGGRADGDLCRGWRAPWNRSPQSPRGPERRAWLPSLPPWLELGLATSSARRAATQRLDSFLPRFLPSGRGGSNPGRTCPSGGSCAPR